MSEKMRAELGCSMVILFAPLFLFGAVVLVYDGDDNIDVVTSYILFSLAALAFFVGSVMWVRHR